MPRSPLSLAFGANVRRIRTAQSIKLGVLARAAGISPANLCNIESGANFPSLLVYARLCQKLGLPKPVFFP